MTPRRLLWVIAALALPLGGFHFAFKQQPDTRTVREVRDAMKRPAEWQGKLAPDFELDLLGGSHFKLSEHVGREVVLLNFFATWCGPCKAEMPELSRFYAQRGDPRVLLIGIDAEEKPELVLGFLRDTPVSFPVGIDGSGDLQRSYGVESFPTTILIGADGRIQLYQSGAIMNADVAFAALLAPNLELIEHGQGIVTEAYLSGLKDEHYPTSKRQAKDEPQLNARAQRIAAGMDCPCGCPDTLQKCGCNTARKAKAKLASMSLDGREDADVMRELNHEFCMKGME